MMLEDWNILATARDFDQRHLARRLRGMGDFRWTAFRGVLIGRVQDHEAFFTQLLRSEETRPGFLRPLAKLVPIERTFEFTVETFPARLKETILPYAEQIDGRSFYVRIERRGHKGEIHGQALEQELDRALSDILKRQGVEPRVEFTDPELIIAVETVGNMCGVGSIPKSLRIRYPFVRIP
jgi:tRNA(Ser,Leu) C12 N-acetylase TAN1